MSTKYKVRDNEKTHFITITIVDWIDVFTRFEQKEKLVNSLQCCQQQKGLIIYGWCLMSNHLHMICRSKDESILLADVIRDFKTFTSKQIIKTIQEEPESRREWMLERFAKACAHLKKKQNFKVWQNGYHAEEIYTQSFLDQKLNYIHQNPVRNAIVEQAEDYLYSSARNYAELDHLLDVEIISQNWKVVK